MKTLKTATAAARKPGHPLHRALAALDGCPVGGWGETRQALIRIDEETPRDRKYTLRELLDAVMQTTGDRYRWRA